MSTSPVASCLARCPPPAVPPCPSSPPSTRAATGQRLTLFTLSTFLALSPCPSSWLFHPVLALSPCPPSWLFHPVYLPGSFTLSTFLAFFPVHLPGFFHLIHLPGSLPWAPSWLFAESACCSVIPFVGYCSVSIWISAFCCV